MVIVINSYRSIPFTKVKTAYVRLYSPEKKKTVAFTRLSKMTEKIGLFFGTFIRQDSSWFFKTMTRAVDGSVARDSIPSILKYLNPPILREPSKLSITGAFYNIFLFFCFLLI